jgi:hypothetical protein
MVVCSESAKRDTASSQMVCAALVVAHIRSDSARSRVLADQAMDVMHVVALEIATEPRRCDERMPQLL